MIISPDTRSSLFKFSGNIWLLKVELKLDKAFSSSLLRLQLVFAIAIQRGFITSNGRSLWRDSVAQ